MHSRKGTLYLLSLGATLSLAGTQVSQLAISARLFELDASGLSSHLVVLNLLGVTLFGLLAGGLLSRFTPRRVGIGGFRLCGAAFILSLLPSFPRELGMSQRGLRAGFSLWS